MIYFMDNVGQGSGAWSQINHTGWQRLWETCVYYRCNIHLWIKIILDDKYTTSITIKHAEVDIWCSWKSDHCGWQPINVDSNVCNGKFFFSCSFSCNGNGHSSKIFYRIFWWCILKIFKILNLLMSKFLCSVLGNSLPLLMAELACHR